MHSAKACGRLDTLKSAYRPRPLFDASMVLLQMIGVERTKVQKVSQPPMVSTQKVTVYEEKVKSPFFE